MATTASPQINLLSLLENDALVDFAPVLIPFLNDIVAAKGDPIKMQLAFMAFLANAAKALPTLEGDFIGQLSSLLLTKIQALQTQAAAALAGAAAKGA